MAGSSGKPLSPKPLSQKLGLKPGFRIFTDGAPVDYRKIVGELPEGAKLLAQPKAPLDMVHVFATEAKSLAGRLRKCRDAIVPDGMIWVSWPKKAAKVETDITEDVIRAEALPLGLVDVKVCAVDETWSGLKLVIRKELRK